VEGGKVVLRPDLAAGRALQLPRSIEGNLPRVVAGALVHRSAAGGTAEIGVDVDTPGNGLSGDQGPDLVVGAVDPGTALLQEGIEFRLCPVAGLGIAAGIGDFFGGIEHGRSCMLAGGILSDARDFQTLLIYEKSMSAGQKWGESGHSDFLKEFWVPITD